MLKIRLKLKNIPKIVFYSFLVLLILTLFNSTVIFIKTKMIPLFFEKISYRLKETRFAQQPHFNNTQIVIKELNTKVN